MDFITLIHKQVTSALFIDVIKQIIIKLLLPNHRGSTNGGWLITCLGLRYNNNMNFCHLYGSLSTVNRLKQSVDITSTPMKHGDVLIT